MYPDRLSMPSLPTSTFPSSRLVILLNAASIETPDALIVPLRYATTAAAMDVAVEIHAVSDSVLFFRLGAVSAELLALIRQAAAHGVEFYVCPVAMTAQGLSSGDLIEEVLGVRGAASLLVAGLESGARFLVF